ncbi:hypothetical protein QQ054_33340 [Oscillatoria amoena NRMC-F 0135]|nr:hypothetical protein [Oscillatoria amoena NRMC-F 0135]
MRKIMLSAFATMAIFTLSSFSSAPGLKPVIVESTTVSDFSEAEFATVNTGDGCLEIFMAWTDALFGYVAAPPRSLEAALYGYSAAFLFGMLMGCIQQ